MTVQITIIGLGQIGTSIGLALSEHKDLVRRVGHDRDPDLSKMAEKVGAVDQIYFNLPSAVRQADVVMLAEPVHHSRDTLQIIAEELKAGAVVMDTGPVKVSMADFASQLLTADRHYVALTPTLNPAYFHEISVGPQAAHADLFKNSLMVITAPPGTSSEAIKLASDLSTLLGATPFFGDPYEIDGLLAATNILPRLAAAALINATTNQPGWREGRKLAGHYYAAVTAPAQEPSELRALAQAALMNQTNVVRVLDDLMNALYEMRSAIADQDDGRLSE